MAPAGSILHRVIYLSSNVTTNPACLFGNNNMSLSAHSTNQLVGGLEGKDLAVLYLRSAAILPMNGWVGKMYGSLVSSTS